MRGYGATPGPERIEDYDLEHLTGDVAHLLDHLKIDKAIVVGHDWGGFVAWGFPLRHPDRAAGVVGLNTPHLPRSPADPIALFRQRFGDSMYIVRFQDPAREPDRIFAQNTKSCSTSCCASRRRRAAAPAAARSTSISQRIVANYDPARDPTAGDRQRGGEGGVRRDRSAAPASPAASTGIATSRATGSAPRTSI